MGGFLPPNISKMKNYLTGIARRFSIGVTHGATAYGWEKSGRFVFWKEVNGFDSLERRGLPGPPFSLSTPEALIGELCQ